MPGKSDPTVTEEELLKAIQGLEKKADVEEEDEDDPKVMTEGLEKSASESVLTNASPALRKALDVSEALAEIVDLFGSHIDESLNTLAKSIEASAQRDLAFVRVVTDLKKSIDGLGEKMETYGEKPAGGASTRVVTAQASELLAKSTGNPIDVKKQSPELLRKRVAGALEALAKSAPPGSQESNQFIRAGIKFDATGKLEDQAVLLAVNKHLNSAA